ncbi:hypothetical protein AMP9_1265 [plant metagenome]|uniref:Uncharacterized protein n=1 Tax=plant metagenome TaxID=1297885 RepID=A0A484PPN7_9ZZZZ
MRRIHPGAFILRCNPHHQRKKRFPRCQQPSDYLPAQLFKSTIFLKYLYTLKQNNVDNRT